MRALSLAAFLTAFGVQSVMSQTAQPASGDLFGAGKVRLIIRTDDVGFCHAANAAFDRIATEGIVNAASVIVTTPWLDEAVEILGRHPEVSVGVHLALNSEWTTFRWGPVAPVADVPSLVDDFGKFFPTRALLNERSPSLDEMETELRAQLDLALRKGLRVSYLDAHMGTTTESRERREILERIAADHGLAISCWFGEQMAAQIYSIAPERKAESLLEQIGALSEPGLYLAVIHPGTDTPEMQALRDANPSGLPNVAAHRQAETDALCDPRLRRLIEERGIELIGYDTLRERFRDQMRDPVTATPPRSPNVASLL
jgi:predicted glycoside hydrolase/deacetylase ChbG (UPF0249 family)